jgi:CHASE3 domain sensor protein
MNIFVNLNLNKKILSGYIFSLLLIVVVGLVAINRLIILNGMVNNLATNLTVDRQIPNDIIAKMLEARYYGAQFIHTHEVDYWQNYSRTLSDVEDYLNLAETNITQVNHIATIEKLQNTITEYKEIYSQIKAAVDKQDEVNKNTLDIQAL